MATVLVVDDLAAHRQLAAGLLTRAGGHEVLFAANGADALKALAQRHTDVVLTDVLMPEMDGLELLRAVHRDYPHLPVILMTASGSEAIAVKALQEGAASYVPKRALARRLAETVSSVLAAARAEWYHAELGKRLIAQDLIFVLENDVELVLALPTYLKPYLLAAGLTDHLPRLRTHIALEEALLNALCHGNLEIGAALQEKNPEDLFRLAAARAQESPYQERHIHVRVRLSPQQAEFSVRDEGPGFNLATLPDSADVASLDQPHGRGVMLMKTFMDEVHYNEAGNAVTMIKRLNPAPVAIIEKLSSE
jgi:CheY-like chemotaxis protein/anti-sigma regulatory factor (Ser/Thr protein kinase)